MIITVKAARINKGMTQEEVAHSIGLSLNGYKRKEGGERRFYIDEMFKLSNLFGIEIQNFLKLRVLKRHDKGDLL
ncbi:helix-turn-helix transcriptional regulator [Paenibacillus nuruki]|uniref:helix-turn-helix transcriptional regulator n=1 Tax=Paenibacillus nuruki TaxID=1886670 RepID=UPI00280378C7|nr:helix-turn-helix transcriptional regulator [Paenibacillus nuruki]CAJ1315962.1 HTH cro/C1-type domain-containing protein [Paenibacillus nuruki]